MRHRICAGSHRAAARSRTRRTQTAARTGIVDQPGERRGEHIGIMRRHHYAAAFVDDLERTAKRGRNHREPCAQRFNIADAEGVGRYIRLAIDVRGLEHARDVGSMAEKFYAIADAEFTRQIAPACPCSGARVGRCAS